MNNSVMKCCICNNENTGRFITISGIKYHLICIEQLQQENKKQEEYITYWQKETDKRQDKIDNAIEYINNNGEKQYNSHDNYRGKWYSPDELDTILEILKDSDVDE